MDLYTMAFILALSIIVYFALAKFLDHKRLSQNFQSRAERYNPKSTNVQQEIERAIQAYDRAKHDYDAAIAKGAKPEQLTDLADDIKRLKFVKDNETIIRLGSPLIDKVGKGLIDMFGE